MPARKTQEQFIAQAIAIHGDKFDYSEVEYKNSSIKVKIYCKTCQKYFLQIPNSHVGKKEAGCRSCSQRAKALSRPKITTEEFIEKARKKHGDTYGYSETKYTHSREEVKIYCKTCEKFFYQRAGHHTDGRGCNDCALRRAVETNKLTTEEFIEKSRKEHGDKYGYDKVDYDTTMAEVVIFCKVCNKYFEQKPRVHLQGSGCPICARNSSNAQKRLTTEEFIEKAREKHGDTYGYDKIDYIDSYTEVVIFCKVCNKYFEQKPTNHLNQHGCPRCKLSKGELAIAKYLDQLEIKYIIEHSFIGLVSDCNVPLRFDFYLPDHNILIEFDGAQHYEYIPGWIKKDISDRIFAHDLQKNEYATEHNIQLIRITAIDNIIDTLYMLPGQSGHFTAN